MPSGSAEQFPAVDRLLPHGPPMRLVDSIVSEIEGGLVCRVVIGDDFVFLKDGAADVAVCIELVAQTIGCISGLRDHREGKGPQPGLLVGCRDARFFADKLHVGDELHVTVTNQWLREPVASFTGKVEREGATIATVELSVISAGPDLIAATEALRDG